MDARNEVIDWLRDAYAMERGLETTLKKISQSDKYPEECRAACGQHLMETQQHAQTVQSLLKSLGTDTSTIKTGIGVTLETLKGLGAILTHDPVVKEMLVSCASEHFEIACYQAIMAAAEIASLPEVVTACRQIISDEKGMAETLNHMLPDIVRYHVAQETMAMAA